MGEMRKEIGELKVELADVKAQLNLILQIVQTSSSRAAEVPLPASIRDHLPGGRPCSTLLEFVEFSLRLEEKPEAKSAFVSYIFVSN